MRFLFKIQMPNDVANQAAKEGFPILPKLLEEQKPEAVYFTAENGMRTCIMVVNMDDASEIPRFAEPWFSSLNAQIDISPVMVPADLEKAGSDIKAAVEKYG